MQNFDEFQRIADQSGFDAALDYLEQVVRREQQYAALFEVLKMRVRRRLGLPVLFQETTSDLPLAQQRDLEDGLLNACREVGTLLIKSGDLQQGWMYLQPVGDRKLNESLIRSIPVDDENIDTLIEVAVSQGAAPAYGFGLLLQHYGTCNGITTFDTQAGMFDRPTQQAMAVTLLDHLYAELMENLGYAVEQAGGSIPDGATLLDVLQHQPGLTEGGAHHIDTTHLASLMRIARMVEAPEQLERAYQLAVYGSGLHPDFQYDGQPPFESTYVDHGYYYGALTGRDIDGAVAHFESKARAADPDQQGPAAVEALVELLVRLGRNDAALQWSMDQLIGKHAPLGMAPDPLTIANTDALRDRLMEFYRTQGDLVSFAACWLKGRDDAPARPPSASTPAR